VSGVKKSRVRISPARPSFSSTNIQIDKKADPALLAMRRMRHGKPATTTSGGITEKNEMYVGGFVPGALDYLTQQHYWRYLFAADRIAGKSVLDIACGAGYGTYHLKSSGAASVVGADLSEHALASCRKHYSEPRTTYSYADCRQLPFQERTFDVVTSFETIEHVRESAAYISEMKRVLKNGGTFICDAAALPDGEAEA